jgi:two-component system, NarL family, nitrate/nitrite response regulator NarL
MNKTLVGLCDSQPLTAEGVRSCLSSSSEFTCLWSVNSLTSVLDLLRRQPVDLILLDKAFGFQTLISTFASIRSIAPRCHGVVWGVSMSESEALRLLQAGARGILRRSSEAATLLASLRSISEGSRWLEDCVFQEAPQRGGVIHSNLTAREQQVLELVRQGMKNREIAGALGITAGTVKIHLKHIFEKTGVNGRYSLVLEGLREVEPNVAAFAAG